jgi:Leucine-rich repeat (LRR) protein
LSLNRLKSLGERTLSGLNQLEEINLANNRIERIGPGAFQSLHHLKILDLSHNRIQVRMDKQRIHIIGYRNKV